MKERVGTAKMKGMANSKDEMKGHNKRQQTSLNHRVLANQNKTKQNKTKQNKTKQNKTKQNKTNQIKSKQTKYQNSKHL